MRKRLARTAIVVAILAAAGFGGHAFHVRLTRNPEASCANCRSFLHWQLDEYASRHGGWYPKGGNNPLDSLAKCVGEVKDVHFFTSHAQAQQLVAYWEAHKTFSSNLCCYRYVEALKTNDPEGLVLLYYWKPTRWECSSHKMGKVGRPVCFHPPRHSWEFVPEAEFQERLSHTLAYLREQGRTFPKGDSHNQGAGANRRPAGQSDGSDNLSATLAADRAFPAAVAELGSLGGIERPKLNSATNS